LARRAKLWNRRISVLRAAALKMTEDKKSCY
jgi:hypothetical protein